MGEHKRRHVFISVLSGGGMLWEDHQVALEQTEDLLRARGWKVTTRRASLSGVCRTRNIMTALFRASGASDLLAWDRDIATSPTSVIAMLDAPFDVVGVCYPERGIDWTRVERAVRMGVKAEYLARFASRGIGTLADGADERPVVTPDGRFYEAIELGTGLLRVKREVIERLIAEYDLAYRADYAPFMGETHHAVFGEMRDPEEDGPTGRYLTEDFLFTRRVRALGIVPYMFGGARVLHSGRWTFEVQYDAVERACAEFNARHAEREARMKDPGL